MITLDGAHTRGYRYRIYPDEEQARNLNAILRDCRSVRNKLIEHVMMLGAPKRNHLKVVKLSGLVKRAVEIKNSYFNDSPAAARALVTVAETLYEQYKRADARLAEYPAFKTPKGYMSAHYPPELYRLDEKGLYVKGVEGLVKIILHRPLPPGRVKKFILSKAPSGEYHVTFTLSLTRLRVSGHREIGLDMGISDLAIDSDGIVYENLKFSQNTLRRITHLKEHLSRKIINSKSWLRLKEKIQRVKRKVINRRRDFLHKLSAWLVKSCRVIGVERLDIKKMLGDEKYRFSIADAGWGEFKRQLIYKIVESTEAKLVFANQFFPSTHICSCCQTKLGFKLDTSIRQWTCPQCGSHHDRDVNAARNLKRVALEAVKEWNQKSSARVILL